MKSLSFAGVVRRGATARAAKALAELVGLSGRRRNKGPRR